MEVMSTASLQAGYDNLLCESVDEVVKESRISKSSMALLYQPRKDKPRR